MGQEQSRNDYRMSKDDITEDKLYKYINYKMCKDKSKCIKYNIADNVNDPNITKWFPDDYFSTINGKNFSKNFGKKARKSRKKSRKRSAR